MTPHRPALRRGVPAVFAFLLATVSGCAAAPADPFAQELAGWSARVRDDTTTTGLWGDARRDAPAAIARAESLIHDGRRDLALARFEPVRDNLSAAWYVHQHPGAARDSAAFEAERTRAANAFDRDVRANALDGVTPEALRAIAEAALPRGRAYYDASLEYGRNTMPLYGLYYVGSAIAQREFVDLCRKMKASAGTPPPVRGLAVEIDALETRLLKLYRPPVSIDRHSEFIAAASMLKEVRELDRLGLRSGALMRYLQGVQRTVMLEGAPAGDSLDARLASWTSRLDARRGDTSLGRLFLDIAATDHAAGRPAAAAIASDVMPAYVAALDPAPPSPPAVKSEVTVTLVRWPYT